MKKVWLVSVLISLFTASCLKMDNFLYNPNVHSIDHYALQNYTGEVEFKNYKGVKKYAVRTPFANHSDIPVLLTFEKHLYIIHHFI